jgi:hypothetical protein
MRHVKIAAAVLSLALASAGGAATHDDGKGHLLDTLTPVVGGMSFSPYKDNVSYVTGHTGFTGGHVVVEGDRLYVGSYGVGMKFFDISTPDAPEFIGEYTPGGARADSVPDAIDYGGRRFAVLNGTNRTSRSVPSPDGRTDRSEFIDATDPAHPVLLHAFLDSVDGEAHNGDIVDERKLWLASGGFPFHGGLRIYDLSPLLETPAAQCRPEAGVDNPCEPNRLFRGDPVELWKKSRYYKPHPSGTEPAFTHTHDITVYTDYPVAGVGPRDIALLAEGGAYANDAGNTGSVFVIDITDPSNPEVLFRWFHERGTGHHPIRYHHEAQFLDGDPRVMLVTDEDLHNGCNAGGVTAVRLSPDLRSATELSEWFIRDAPAPVCSVHVFTSHGNLVFFGSYNAGLQVVDYSNPAAPQRVGHYIAEGATSWVAHYHQGYVYMGDMSRGLDVLRWHGPAPDLAIASSDITFSPEKVRGDKQVGITATVHNVGRVRASDAKVRFSIDGMEIATQTIRSIPAGGSATASVTWSTKHRDGEHTVTVTADPANEIDEESESNNEARRSFVVHGNQVQNGSFEESSSGSAPDAWSASGETAYSATGTEGERGVSAGFLGSWTSEAVPVVAGASYGVSAAVAGGGTLAVEQLSTTGQVLATTSLAASGWADAFEPVTGALAAVPGAAAVRLVLVGGLGGANFDDVRLWEE